MLTTEESQYNYNNLTMRTGCSEASDSLSCLRDLSLDALQQENIAIPYPQTIKRPLYSYGPTIDGTLIPNLTSHLFEQGQFLKVPIIFGDDTNEGTIFVPRNLSSTTAAITFIKDQFPYISFSELDWFKKTYLSRPDSENFKNAGHYWQVTSNGYGEMRYICPGIALSRLFTSYGVSDTWNYHYAVLDRVENKGYGTAHTTELNAIWGPDNIGGTPLQSYYSNNAAIVPVMQGYWTSFIRSYDPNIHRYPGSPEWGTWGDNYTRLFMRTNETKMEDVPNNQRERCKYLVSVEQDLRQ
jgi:carboxylesterase type B